MDEYFLASLKLHRYLVAHHWDGQSLVGPDPGPRFSYRVGRFIKSYLRWLPWRDDYYYLQAQGYWLLGNWRMSACTGDPVYASLASCCAEYMLSRQCDDGAWVYPHPEWKGRIASFEGTWGSLGLLETYRQTQDLAFLTGALRWHRFLTETIGYQRIADELSVNYFASRPNAARVLNNSTFVLRFLAELADVTGNTTYRRPCAGLLTFLQHAQRPTGELPYTVAGQAGGAERPHFQCYQYNAFQCLDLIRYHEVTGDPAALPLIAGVLRFLRTGLAADGHAYYACGNRHRAVTYHAAVLGAAFAKADRLGIGDYIGPARLAYAYVLGLQRQDGGLVYSRCDYYVLNDQRSYPRYLAMILYHLLEADDPVGGDASAKIAGSSRAAPAGESKAFSKRSRPFP